mmetsp:Transcript_3157/g.5860  ORF Transcript_3157/g.5860 Transcript_3157/m.5860 type:complete len:210 (+) Transcript_3157:1216-1845(+)
MTSRDLDTRDEAGDGFSTIGNSAVTEELVHNLTTAHANVFIGLEGITNVDLNIGGRDEFHSAHLTIHSGLRNVELPNHTKRNRTSTWLSIIHLPLEQDRVNILLLRKDLSSASSRRSSAHDGHLVLHVQGRGGGNTVGDSAIDERGGGEGGGGADNEGGDGELHGAKKLRTTDVDLLTTQTKIVRPIVLVRCRSSSKEQTQGEKILAVS